MVLKFKLYCNEKVIKKILKNKNIYVIKLNIYLKDKEEESF